MQKYKKYVIQHTFSATFCFDLTYFCNILLFHREFYKRSHFFLAKILSEGENE